MVTFKSPANTPDSVKSVVFSARKPLVSTTAAPMIIPIGEQLSERLRVVFSPLQSIAPQFLLVQFKCITCSLLRLFIWFVICAIASQVVPLTGGMVVGVGSEPVECVGLDRVDRDPVPGGAVELVVGVRYFVG